MQVMALSNVWSHLRALCCTADDVPSDVFTRIARGPSANFSADGSSSSKTPGSRGSVPLRVTCASGQVLQLVSETSMAVADLKEELAAASGVSAAKQVLIAPGFYVMGPHGLMARRRLEDSELLGSIHEQIVLLSDDGGREAILELNLHHADSSKISDSSDSEGDEDESERGGALPGSSTDTDVVPRIKVIATQTETKAKDAQVEVEQPQERLRDSEANAVGTRRSASDTGLGAASAASGSGGEQPDKPTERRRTLADPYAHQRRRSQQPGRTRISIIAPEESPGGRKTSEDSVDTRSTPQGARHTQAGFTSVIKNQKSAMELVRVLASPELMGGQVVEMCSYGSSSSLDFPKTSNVLKLPSGAQLPEDLASMTFSSSSTASASSNSEPEEEELEEEPPPRANMWKRRGGVSAEACGAYNRRFVEWKMNVVNKTREELEVIMEGLRNFPPLSRVTMPVIQALASTVEIEEYEDGACICVQGEVGRSGYILIEGASVDVYVEDGSDVIVNSNNVRRSSQQEKRGVFVRKLPAGHFFGEYTMLWGFRRSANIYARGRCRIGKVKRDSFFNLVPRYEMEKRHNREALLRKARVFETLDDEQIAMIADVMSRHKFYPGDSLIRQGEVGREYFIVLEGECKAEVRIDLEARDGWGSASLAGHVAGQVGEAVGGVVGELVGQLGQVQKKMTRCATKPVTTILDEAAREAGALQEHARYYPGDSFGERGFILGEPRGATVTALTEVSVLRFKRSQFERMFGDLGTLQTEHYLHDPRMTLSDFYRSGDKRGPRGVTQEEPSPDCMTEWFAVYRPTSRDAIAKMLAKKAVGKGLNVKGKSAKKAHLSGYVPFLQIHTDEHRQLIEESPPDTRVTIFYQTAESRDFAMAQCQKILWQEVSLGLVGDPMLSLIDTYGDMYGLELHERVMREAYIETQNLAFLVGWDTGRKSVPSFMDMNLHALRGDMQPKVVLYQYDSQHAMNPHGLLMAYAEDCVKPVVSDFDTFTVGSKGMDYDEPLPREQWELALHSLEGTESILREQETQAEGEENLKTNWTDQWIEVLRHQKETGYEVVLPQYGFGDPTSYGLIKSVVQASKDTGAVRHGAECFNFHFPQELDHTYLVVWEGFVEDLPWRYFKEDELRDFLLERVEEGFIFPLNPVWAVRDQGWFDVFQAVLASSGAQKQVHSWYPPESGIIEKVQELHERFPAGFVEEPSTLVPRHLQQRDHVAFIPKTPHGAGLSLSQLVLADAWSTMSELCCKSSEDLDASPFKDDDVPPPRPLRPALRARTLHLDQLDYLNGEDLDLDDDMDALERADLHHHHVDVEHAKLRSMGVATRLVFKMHHLFRMQKRKQRLMAELRTRSRSFVTATKTRSTSGGPLHLANSDGIRIRKQNLLAELRSRTNTVAATKSRNTNAVMGKTATDKIDAMRASSTSTPASTLRRNSADLGEVNRDILERRRLAKRCSASENLAEEVAVPAPSAAASSRSAASGEVSKSELRRSSRLARVQE